MTDSNQFRYFIVFGTVPIVRNRDGPCTIVTGNGLFPTNIHCAAVLIRTICERTKDDGFYEFGTGVIITELTEVRNQEELNRFFGPSYVTLIFGQINEKRHFTKTEDAVDWIIECDKRNK